jgi:hypothetical protein
MEEPQQMAVTQFSQQSHLLVAVLLVITMVEIQAQVVQAVAVATEIAE